MKIEEEIKLMLNNIILAGFNSKDIESLRWFQAQAMILQDVLEIKQDGFSDEEKKDEQ